MTKPKNKLTTAPTCSDSEMAKAEAVAKLAGDMYFTNRDQFLVNLTYIILGVRETMDALSEWVCKDVSEELLLAVYKRAADMTAKPELK